MYAKNEESLQDKAEKCFWTDLSVMSAVAAKIKSRKNK